MADRTKLVAGNWKMNGLSADAATLARDVAAGAGSAGCEMLVCPPFTLLATVHAALAGSRVGLGGQDCHAAQKGAHTGDISAEMLRDAGCGHVILGHSERRHGHCEKDAEVQQKVAAAWRAGLQAIVCVGETKAERAAGNATSVVAAQLAGSVPAAARADTLVIAYEPVWAIGTGLTPTGADIVAMHQAIRARSPSGTRILYGGSVNPKNAAEILALADVDGALVGGASLNAADFLAIAAACR